MFTSLRPRLMLPILGALALTLFASAAPRVQADDGNLPIYTSPIDITGLRLKIEATVPDRDSGKPIIAPLPNGVLPPEMEAVLATPLSTQFDQNWAVNKDPKTGKTPRETACDGEKGIVKEVEKAVAKQGDAYRAYEITCNLATTGMLVTKQVGSTLSLGYLLTNNSVGFKSTSPYTCKEGNGTIFCPNDPRFTVSFAIELVTVVRTPSLCQITAEGGTVYTQAVDIQDQNFAATTAMLIKGSEFFAAERSIEAAQQQAPLPLDASFKKLRDSAACTGKAPGVSRVLTAFKELETIIDLRQGVILRVGHVGLATPTVDAPNPGAAPVPVPLDQTSFTRPMISTGQPVATAGTAVQVSGQYFPPSVNFATALPITLGHGGYGENSVILGGVCFGGATELQWGPVGGQQKVERLAGGADGRCATSFNATNLTPSTAYQFRARDCDPLTCSPWSALLKVTTAKGDPNKDKVTLTLDNGIALATTTVNAQGKFEATVTIPAGTAAGTHTIYAVSGDAKAQEPIQVTAPAPAGGSNGSLMMVGLFTGQTGCPNNPINSTTVDDTFQLFGSGLMAGSVTIRLDSATGLSLGTATVKADGTFCQKMQAAPANQAGAHTLVAVQNGAVVARLNVTFVLPYVVR